jgi:hypothetical protein
MYDIKWIGEIMNKNKIGLAVLLLGLSLGPVQTSQNYSIRLNNLVYAEEEQGEDSAEKSEDGEKKEEQPVTDRAAQDNPPVQPLKEKDPKGKETDPNVKETVKAEVEKFNSEVEASNVYKLATEKEKEAYKKAYKAILEDIEKEVKKDGKAEDYIDAYKKALLKDSMELGYTVVKNILNRIKLRNLKADLDQLEEAAKTAKLELPADLKTLAEKADKILAEKDHETDEIEENVKVFSDAIDKFKKDNKLTIKESKLSDEEAKYGYPDDVYTKGMGETKDLSEVRLDAKIFLEATNSDDTKIERRLGDLYKKDSLTDKEKEEKKNLEAYKSSKSNLENNLYNLDVRVENLKSYLDAYVVAVSKVIINAEPSKDQKKFDEFDKKLKDIRESDKAFRESDNYKNVNEELKKKYDDAFKALDGIAGSSPDAESKIVAVENAKKAIEDLGSKITEALNDKFKESDEYKRATKDLQKAYDTAYDALKEKKGKTELDNLDKTKKDIKDYYSEFNSKYEALEKYIDQAKSDKLKDDDLKKLKEEYKEKLEGYKTDFSKKIDDLNKLEKEFNDSLDGKDAKPKSKTTKRLVSTKKNAGGKVRTGVESVLPLAGGVLVVAAIALVLTRKKNK